MSKGAVRPRVGVGQVWSTMTNDQRKIEVGIVSVGPMVEVLTMFGKKRRFFIPQSHFRTGLRGLRLVRYADGTPSSLPKPQYLPLISPEERRTASELVKATAPRGLAKASDADKETLRLFEEGVSGPDLAKRFKVSRGTIHCRIARAREAMQDERNARALRQA